MSSLITLVTCFTLTLLSNGVSAQHIKEFGQMLDEILAQSKQHHWTQAANDRSLDSFGGETESLLEWMEIFSPFGMGYTLQQNYTYTLTSLQREVESLNEETGVSKCFNDSLQIINGLIKNEAWAKTLLDAIGKPPSGILLGNFNWLGEFSQCRDIIAMTTETQAAKAEPLFQGQYCLVSLVNSSSPPQMAGAPATGLNVGICVPDSCSENQTASLLQLLADRMNGTDVRVTCKPKSPPPFNAGAIAVLVILAVLAALIACATIYDYVISRQSDTVLQNVNDQDTAGNRAVEPTQTTQPNISSSLGVNEYTPLLGSGNDVPMEEVQIKQQKSLGVRLLLCFSLLTNGAKLLSTKPTNQKNLAAIHGIRFISMSWVILGHTFMFVLMSGANPAVVVTNYIRRYSFMAILGASVSVDTFFLLSGALAAYMLLNQIKEMDGPRNVNWVLVYFHRFWRLTPPYMLVIAVYTTLFHYMGDGPSFPDGPDPACREHWWQNLLYINNFFTTTAGCIGWTWYLANDMQFFLIAPLVVVALYKWVAVGAVMIFSLVLMNMIVVGVLTKINNYPSDLQGMNLQIMAGNPTQTNDWMADVYVRPYARVGVYAIGLALGYILHRTDLKIRLNKVTVLLGWLVAFVACYEVVYGLYGVSYGNVVLSPGVNAFYASVHRIVWAIGVSWVIFACVTGYGGPVNTFLSWTAMVPLSRLTYMAYLVHLIVISYTVLTTEQTIFISTVSLTYYFIGTIVLSYAVAFVTSLAFEAPMMALEKVVFPRKK